MLEALCEKHDIEMDIPINELNNDKLNLLLYGDNEEKCIIKFEMGKRIAKEH